jgi:sugar lactone lactonase YvrE
LDQSEREHSLTSPVNLCVRFQVCVEANLTVDDRAVTAKDAKYANGVAFDLARRTLYVSEHLGRRILALTAARREEARAMIFSGARPGS